MPLLGALADKIRQYCHLVADVDGDVLARESEGDYERLREYLRMRGVNAYDEKVQVQKLNKRLNCKVRWICFIGVITC